MKAILRSGFLALAIMALAVSADAGPFEEGLAAYKQGDYPTALQFWRPLAEQGNPAAQFNLGFMYGNGRGEAEDDAEAVKWYSKAAEQGVVGAMFLIGSTYASGGRGVPPNLVPANMWFNIAAAYGDENGRKQRDFWARFLTPDQLADAERMTREWLEKHQQPSNSFSKIPRPRP